MFQMKTGNFQTRFTLHDFSRLPPFDIDNIFKKNVFNTTIGMSSVTKIAENALQDLYYKYANVHAFTTF